MGREESGRKREGEAILGKGKREGWSKRKRYKEKDGDGEKEGGMEKWEENR